VTVNSNFLPVA